MKRLFAGAPLRFAFVPMLVPLMIFAACADSGDEATPDDGGTTDASRSDGGDAATDARDVDAETLRCSSEFCLVDLPNPGAYGFTKWMFAGVQVDPILGIWAIANGVSGTDPSTAQLLRFENGAWKPMYAPTLGSGGGKRNVRLSALATDGAGKLMAIGTTMDDGTTVIVQGDGTTFTTTTFDGTLSALWFAAAGQAWAVGPSGGIYRTASDGGWISESTDAGRDFMSVWGTGPDDVYVGGVSWDDFIEESYLGHRTIDDGGVKRWTFRTFGEIQNLRYGDRNILAGISPTGGSCFWAAPSVLARTVKDGGEDEWIADPFQPRVAIRSFWARGKDDIWGVGEVGRLLHFDGAEWKDLLLIFNGAPLTPNLTGIAGTSAGEVIVVGEDVALWRQAK